MTTECGAGLHDGVRVVAHCSLEPGHTGWHEDDEIARAWAPGHAVGGSIVPGYYLEGVELPHMPGCTDPDHRPLTSLCTTEPYRTGIPRASA